MNPSNDNERILAVWASGGDIVGPGGPISLAQAKNLYAFHSRYALDAEARGDRSEARKAALVACDYHGAIQDAERWQATWRIAR